ncbi:MAG: hypothetical protein JJE52_12785 [Acidimicrobiia bacterium]|nr:hypothetical protein [Acidimicrobiia bacterium]
MAAYAVALTVLGACIPVLGYVGVRAVLDSSDGEVIDPVLDPNEPRYQALVPPSPTLLVLQTDAAGSLVGTVLLSLPSGDAVGGGVLLMPPGTLADIPEIGRLPIEASYDFNGADSARSTAERAMHVGIDEVVVITAAEWADMVELTGPVTVTNPDVLRGADGSVVFPAGRLELAPDDVALFAGFVSPDESRLNRVLRQELVWSAWLGDLADAPEGLVFPGEQERGIARFLTAIVAGTHRVESLPVVADAEANEPGSTVGFTVDEEALAELVPRLIPFPTGAMPGDRPLVKVLAGVADRSLIQPAVRRAVATGGQVVMIGNAEHFDHPETEVRFAEPALRSYAESVVEALGFGTVMQVDEIDDSAQVIVVLGADADL